MLTRLLDIVVSLFGCLILAVLLPVIAFLIKLDSSGPIFYQAKRVGKNGKIFNMYKFRTMFHTQVPLGASVCPQGDPRVTDFGRILRRLKLNEFPQFINVLKGDMTLVGPRPESPSLAAAYPSEAHLIFSVKPGLVGPNQILGRNEEELYPEGYDPRQYYLENILPQKLPLDLQYIKEKSFLKDLKYLVLGIWVTLSGAVKRQHLTDNLTQIFMLAADVVLCLASFTLAHIIRFEGFVPDGTTEAFLKILPLTVLARIPILFQFGCYQTLIRYFRMHDLNLVFQGVTLGSGILVIISYLSGLTFIGGYARSVFIVDWLCLTVMLVGYRGFLKSAHQHFHKKQNGALSNGERRRALIWGSGDEGLWCLSYLESSRDPAYHVVGFIDENPRMRNRRINGLQVLGDYHHLDILAPLYNIQEIFVAAKDVPPAKMQRVQVFCNQQAITLKCFVPHKINEITPPPQTQKH